jgi:hypothetical protein
MVSGIFGLVGVSQQTEQFGDNVSRFRTGTILRVCTSDVCLRDAPEVGPPGVKSVLCCRLKTDFRKKKKNWVRGYRSFPDLPKEKFHTGNRVRVVPLHSRGDRSKPQSHKDNAVARL